MAGSVAEVQSLSDQILELLGVRLGSGELVIRYDHGTVQRCETRTVHRPQPQALRKALSSSHDTDQPISR